MKKYGLVFFLILMVVFSGCTEKKEEPIDLVVNETPVPTPTPGFELPEYPTVFIEIKGSKFIPSEPLQIIQGTTVRWTNKDSAAYVIHVDGFQSPPLNKYEVWNHTFTQKGIFEYNCINKPSMPEGLIIVE